MVTVGDVVDRILRDYLIPPDEQPTRFQVGAGGVDESAVTLPVDTAMLSPEETDLIGPGALIEAGSELMLIEATDDPPTSLTVRRGMYGTDAASHTAGDYIVLAPDFPRRQVFEAVCDTVEALWPDLWVNNVAEVWTSTGPVELPADVGEITDIRAAWRDGWVPVESWDLIRGFPHVSTGVALQVGGSPNCALHVYYRQIPQRPTAESDELADLGVSDGWVKIIAVGATAEVIAGEDIDRATVEFITQALEMEGMQTAGADIRNSLLQYQDFLMRPVKRALEQATPQRTMLTGGW